MKVRDEDMQKLHNAMYDFVLLQFVQSASRNCATATRCLWIVMKNTFCCIGE